jgi:general secretion pathway protein F
MTTTVFAYVAVDQSGKTRRGNLEADSSEQVNELLLQKGLHAFEIEQAREDKLFSNARWGLGNPASVNLRQREEFYRKSAVLLQAGISIDRVMRILSSDLKNRSKNVLVAAIEREISKGESFSSALRKKVPQATAAELTAIRASEKTGQLAETLLALANQLALQTELRAKLFSMMVYPLFLMALIPLVLVFVGLVLVPNIAPLFENSGRQMPLLLSIFVEISEALKTYPIAISAIAVLLVAALVVASKNAAIRRKILYLFFALPFLTKLRRQHLLQMFCQSMGTLLGNGTTLQDALDALASGEQTEKINRARSQVSEGGKLAEALRENDLLDQESAQIIAIGEESNQLANMFLHVGATIQKDYAAHLERLMTLLVPFLTLFIGLLVGGVMVSVMSALLAVNEVPFQ